MHNLIVEFDVHVVGLFQKLFPVAARISLFVVFFWFGALKIFATSPANPLVGDLLHRTLPFVSFETFIVFLGAWEMAIGLAFLIPGLERLAIALLVPHMGTTVMPLVLLPAVTWSGFLVPTLEGQYIIKNSVIIALAAGVATRLKPISKISNHKTA